MAIRITKRFHRLWLGTLVPLLLILWFAPIRIYSSPIFWALAGQSTSRWNNWNKMYNLSLEEWTLATRMVRAYNAGNCGVSESIKGNAPCPDAPKLLDFEKDNPDQERYALSEADGLLPDIRRNVFVFVVALIFVPYVLVPTINWVDGLVHDSDEDPLNIREKLK